jgi:Ca2+-binding RTX toxin-like protein
MSSILAEFSTTPLLETTNSSMGLDIIGKDGQTNAFFIQGDCGDNVIGGNQADLIKSGLGDDVIIGGSGSDILDAGAGDDIIVGGNGSDIIRAGSGVDIITGGQGADIFEFFGEEFLPGEVDTITDFTEGEDIVRLKGIGNDADVQYDKASGKVSINGEDVLQLDSGLDVTIKDSDRNGNWELF